MKNFLGSFSVVIATLITSQLYAQDVIKGNDGMYPSFVDFKNAAPAFTNGKVFLTDDAGKISSNTTAILQNMQPDALGMQHYRYQQSFAGIAVENATYVLHVQNGKVVTENGEWVKNFPSNLNPSATINFNAALQKAMAFVGAQSYKWQIPAEEALIKREQNDLNATFFPKHELVFYAGEQEINPSNLRLAYKLDIYANYPLSRQKVYVDAANGKILGTKEMIHKTNANGSAVTAYSGTQSITTDNTGTTYRLRETGRGNGINTYNMKNAGTSYAAAVDFTDADNNWNNVNANLDQYATDGHWGTEKTYDYYFTKFNRNSIDNAGFALNSYVHTNLVAFGYANNINAFWDGNRMIYGDGGTIGTSTFNPLTALDVCGHEVTHGITERTSNLAYQKESGALNEGFSDIFGTAIEFYAKGTGGNWTLGENVGVTFRSMSNPNLYSQPDTYGGTYWVSVVNCTPAPNNDYCGVHTNSGVLNFWFYTLSQGGSGTNDIGNAYNVTGIGIDKAAAIAFRTNTAYLTSSSTFANARTYAIQSAKDLYGAGSAEEIATTNAWYAVGVGAAYTAGGTCAAPTGLVSSSITSSGATVSWTAVSGAASYKVEYKTNAATTWTVAATATTATSISLTGLTAATAYNYRVTTNCAATTSSATAGTFTTLSAGGCQSSYDNATNGTASGAATIPFNTNITGLINVAGDVDFYKFTITTGGTATITLSTLPADYDLQLLSSNGTTQLAISQNSSTTNETITRTYTAGTYYVRVYGYNNANNATTCYTLKVQLGTATFTGTGTEITQTGLLKIFPNPVSDVINVSVLGAVSPKSVVNITDVNGKVVLTENIVSSVQQLNVSRLAKGVYFVKVNNGGKDLTAKFIKQ